MTRKLPIYLKEEEFYKLIKATNNKAHKLAFLLAFNSGLRISEVTNLTKDNLDFDKNRITILNGKGGKDRIVPLPKQFPKSYLPIIPLKIGVRALQIAFKRNLTLARINKPLATFHSLRHSFAVRCLERGMPVNIVQVLLGHSNLQTTSIYTLVTGGDALKKYEELW